MDQATFNQGLLAFIQSSPTPAHAVASMAAILAGVALAFILYSAVIFVGASSQWTIISDYLLCNIAPVALWSCFFLLCRHNRFDFCHYTIDTFHYFIDLSFQLQIIRIRHSVIPIKIKFIVAVRFPFRLIFLRPNWTDFRLSAELVSMPIFSNTL